MSRGHQARRRRAYNTRQHDVRERRGRHGYAWDDERGPERDDQVQRPFRPARRTDDHRPAAGP